MEEGIRIRRSEGLEAASKYIQSNDGLQVMGELQKELSEFTRAETGLLVQRSITMHQAYRTAVTASLMSGLLGLGLVGAYGIMAFRMLHLRTQSSAALFKERELLRVTLSSIGDGVITTDLQGNVTFLNPIAEQLCGWTTEEARNYSLTEVFGIVNEATRQTVDNPALRALAEGTIVGLANHTVLINRKGGDCAIADSAAPIRGIDGQLLGAVLVFRDVTEQRLADDLIRKSARELRQQADAMPQIVWVALPDGSLQYYNQKWYDYTGCTPEDCLGHKENIWIHPEDRDLSLERWNESLRTGQPFEIERRLLSKSGEYNWFLGRALPIHGEDGTVIRWLGTSTDITERKRLEDHLRVVAANLSEANHRKNEFLAMLAHELRNPLAPIRTGLELMKHAQNDLTLINDTRNMMERQTSQMVRLIDDLLDVSRISQGKLQLRKARISLSEVLQTSIEAVQPSIDEAGHRLHVSQHSEPIFLQADPNRLAQVISNLLSNAVKYTPDNGAIHISTELERNHALIRVRDSGLGIPLDKHSRIFELFAQVDRPMEQGYTGLGIGLTLVKRITEMHDGQVEVVSAGVGHGSEFIVRLPFDPEKEVPGQSDAGHDQTPAKQGRSFRILIVDDNQAAADTLRMMLRIMGHDATMAHDGYDGIEAAERLRPEVILMDLGMPRMNGYEAAQAIRKAAWGQQIVLIALTGWSQDEDQQRTRAAGFDHHLTKPADPAVLQALLLQLELCDE